MIYAPCTNTQTIYMHLFFYLYTYNKVIPKHVIVALSMVTALQIFKLHHLGAVFSHFQNAKTINHLPLIKEHFKYKETKDVLSDSEII